MKTIRILKIKEYKEEKVNSEIYPVKKKDICSNYEKSHNYFL